jgi:hypothetical protein
MQRRYRPASVRAIAPLMLFVASIAALAAPQPAHAQECAGRAILLFRSIVYSEEPIPPGLAAEPGEPLAFGRVGFLPGPEGSEECDPLSAQVFEIAGLPPDLAVAVEGREGFVFALGARCAGFEDEERAACILRPLQFEGRLYSGARYPAETEEPRIEAGESLGNGELDARTVTAVAIRGVDPAVAVGVEGRPDEAFVAAGACPYERFGATLLQDDLSRCLRGPLWLIFQLERPPSARVGDQITARADRAVAPVVDGASVSLVRLEVAADIVPRDTSGAVEIGRLEVGPDGQVALPITVPDVAEGIYEAIVTCEACAESFGGRTVFPAGSLVIVPAGSEGPRLIGIVIGAVAIGLAIAAFLVWRRGWYRPRLGRRGPPSGGDQ